MMMKGKQSPRFSKPKSFGVAIEQMAQFLRSQIKLKEKRYRFSLSHFSKSFQNSLEQIAKMLRSEVQNLKVGQKRRSRKQNRIDD